MNKFIISLLSLVLCVGLQLRAEGTSFDSVEQTNAIAAALQQYYGIEGSFELSPVSPLAVLGTVPTSVELLEVPAAPLSNMIVKARYLKDAAVVGEISAAFRAQWRVNVLVARRQVGKGSFDASNFETQTIDRLALRQMPVDPTADLKGFEVTSPISAGTPLCWNQLKSQPLVRKGALVDVVAQDGGMKITTRAIATHDAGKNESVIMKNLTTNRPFEAYVINENLVQIRF